MSEFYRSKFDQTNQFEFKLVNKFNLIEQIDAFMWTVSRTTTIQLDRTLEVYN